MDCLRRSRGPTEGQKNGLVDFTNHIRTGFADKSLRKIDGLVLDESTVEKIQGLQGRGRCRSSRPGQGAIGAIEQAEHWIALRARLELVDHAPKFIGLQMGSRFE